MLLTVMRNGTFCTSIARTKRGNLTLFLVAHAHNILPRSGPLSVAPTQMPF